jgi:hypothetical protein
MNIFAYTVIILFVALLVYEGWKSYHKIRFYDRLIKKEAEYQSLQTASFMASRTQEDELCMRKSTARLLASKASFGVTPMTHIRSHSDLNPYEQESKIESLQSTQPD